MSNLNAFPQTHFNNLECYHWSTSWIGKQDDLIHLEIDDCGGFFEDWPGV